MLGPMYINAALRLITPLPYVLSSPAVPRSVAVVNKIAFICFPVRFGETDLSKATLPPTCGEAIDVPVILPYPPGMVERTDVPGATTSGFIKSVPEPPQIDGPRLDDDVIVHGNDVFPLIFPTANVLTESMLRFFGGVIDDALGPELPAENITAVPTASTAVRVLIYIVELHCVLPDCDGSCHEQLIASGMSIVFTLLSGSIAHWYASIFIDGYDAPGQSVIPAAIQRASGATPTVSPGSIPHIIPIV